MQFYSFVCSLAAAGCCQLLYAYNLYHRALWLTKTVGNRSLFLPLCLYGFWGFFWYLDKLRLLLSPLDARHTVLGDFEIPYLCLTRHDQSRSSDVYWD